MVYSQEIRMLFLLLVPTQGGYIGGEVGARMEVKRLVKLCEDRGKRLALIKTRKVARNVVKRCVKIKPPGLNGGLRTIWHTSHTGRLTH